MTSPAADARVQQILAAGLSADDSDVGEALVDHGQAFVVGVEELRHRDPGSEGLRDTMWRLILAWLGGASLANRAYEDESRARFALWIMRVQPGLARLAANAVFQLPQDHELHDRDAVREALLAQLRRGVVDGFDDPMQLASALDAIAGLVQHELLPEEELRSWIDKGDRAERTVQLPDRAVGFRRIAATHLVGQANLLDDPAEQAAIVAGARTVLAPALEVPEPDRETMIVAMVIEMVERGGSGAAFADVIDANAGADDGLNVFAVVQQSKFAFRDAEFADVVDMLEPVVPSLEQRYVEAYTQKAIDAEGELFTDTTMRLAFALGRLGRWEQTVAALDLAKSRRYRHRAALRSGPDGSRVVELERALLDQERGVEPDVADVIEYDAVDAADGLSLRSRLLEAYRRATVRARGDAEAQSDLEGWQTLIAADTAVAVLGISSLGIIVVVASGGALRGEVLDGDAASEVLNGFTGVDGWLPALAAPGLGLDVKRTLANLLDQVDRVVGSQIVELAAPGISRLVVVPSGVLHLVPFWALPRFGDLVVTVAPTLAHYVEWQETAAPQPLAMVAVGNPTGDLPTAMAEAAAVRQRLADRGVPATMLRRNEATEPAITAAVAHCGLLHFSGHGIGDMVRPDLSALLVHPELEAGATDPLARLSEQADWGPMADNERWADTQDGRLWEQVMPVSGQIKRRLERTRGTLQATYEWIVDDAPLADDDEVVSEYLKLSETTDRDAARAALATPRGQELVAALRTTPITDHRVEVLREAGDTGTPLEGRLQSLAEMWTAGDMRSEGALAECSLAFLSSCESALGELNPYTDEYAGLPAALHLAGVDAVVAPLWPVDAGMTALFADIFYEQLLGALPAVDCAELVDHCRRTLRGISGDDAATRFARMATLARDAMTRLVLEARAHAARLTVGALYAEPIDWAAFHVVGHSRLRFTAIPD